MSFEKIPTSVQLLMDEVTEKCGNENKAWSDVFNNCFANTLLTTLKEQPDGSYFVLTGDIPAMWLRDSTAQVRPYLVVADKDEEIKKMILGVLKRQMMYINHDPYANAFNETNNNAGHQDDQTEMSPLIWERKYEIDSLCYPIQLAYLLYLATGETKQFDENFVEAVKKILALWKVEQNHANSPYTFERDTWRKEDTLVRNGRGTPVAETGMTWSGFRPSDDACQYGYLVPSNMFAVVVLGYIETIFHSILVDEGIVRKAAALKKEIQEGILKHAVVENENGEKVYAYEVDGIGNFSIMDDSNVPSLLSAPYLGYCDSDDPLYVKTRKTLLSPENPYYYEGICAKGIGSSHTPTDYIWPIALAMEGLTTKNRQEKKRILNLLVENDGGTGLMHEGFHVDDSTKFTREWFSWANMMFCELLLDYLGIQIKSK